MTTLQTYVLKNLLSHQMRGSGFYGGDHWVSRSFSNASGNANLGTPKPIPRLVRDRRSVEEVLLDLSAGKRNLYNREDLTLGLVRAFWKIKKEGKNFGKLMDDMQEEVEEVEMEEQEVDFITLGIFKDFWTRIEDEEEEEKIFQEYLSYVKKRKAEEKRRRLGLCRRRPVEGKLTIRETRTKAKKSSKSCRTSSKRQKFAECEMMNVDYSHLSHVARKSNFVAGRRRPAGRRNINKKLVLDVALASNIPHTMGYEQFDSCLPNDSREENFVSYPLAAPLQADVHHIPLADKMARIRYLTKMRVRAFRARRKAMEVPASPSPNTALDRTRHLTKMRVRAYRARQRDGGRNGAANGRERNIIRIPNPYFTRERLTIRIPNPFARIITINEVPNFPDDVAEDYIGAMSNLCEYCGAKLYNGETSSLCCKNGKVQLPSITAPPEALRRLFTENTRIAKHFRNNIRAYNSVFAFTSLGANIDERFTRNGIYKFRIHGSIYHRIGSLLPQNNDLPKFGQIYIYDSDYQNSLRGDLMNGLDVDLIRELQNIMNEVNPFVQDFRMAAQAMENDATLKFVIKERKGTDLRRYNAPSASEVAVIIPGDGMEGTTCRDVVISKNDGTVKRISEMNCAYDPLHYVLLFPNGDHGFHLGINYQNAPGVRKTVTPADFYAYRLMIRNNDPSMLHYAGRLLQQYIVDGYSKVESGRINYIRTHQRELRADLYQGLVDAVANDIEAANIGQKIILPSSFTGGPRHMHQLYQDSMAIIREYGKPDVFLTFTCNPKWREIEDELLPGQTAVNRPDLTARVFRLKLNKIVDKVYKKSFFGRVVAHIHVIEFQKRGLPHAHMLIILDAENKFRGVADIDRYICAEIPDKDRNPRLYEIVKKSMMHGPCGIGYPNSPCMKDGRCSKGFPKSFQPETADNVDGYPLYRRRENGSTVTVKGAILDNRWVVPYNPTLLLLFNAHINVECCSSIVAVKYLYKYVYKGHDRVSVTLDRNDRPVDECTEYLDGRYVSDCESFYRICAFRLHDEHPCVQRLQIHLPNQQQVVFGIERPAEQVLADNRETMLTQYFKLNSDDAEARELFYHEICKKYVWNKKTKKWTRRVRASNIIARMYFVSPMAGERYYLRLLLHNVKGAKSFEDLRTVDNVCYETLKEAAHHRGLLDSDEEYRKCLEEAALFQTGKQLRHLFLQILIYGEPATPAVLWEEFKNQICEDIVHLIRINHPNAEEALIPTLAEEMGLYDLNNLLLDNGKCLGDFPDMPQLVQERIMQLANLPVTEMLQEQAYSREELEELVNTNVPKFNDEQLNAYESIRETVLNGQGQVFYLDGPGGTGKTFVYNTLLASIRKEGQIALAIASSGIAAQLLYNGRTGHSTLKIPININELSTCSIRLQSPLAQLLQQVKLIVWDEAPMMHKHVYEAVDRTLRDVMRPINEERANKVFGGIPIVFGGDFRQILPVIIKGCQADIVNASLNKASFWNNVTILRLTKNMRLLANCSAEDVQRKTVFSDMVLSIGEGTYPHDGHDNITLPEELCLDSGNIESLIRHTFPNLAARFMEREWISQRAILTPKNEDMFAVNNIALDMLPGEVISLPSADSTEQAHLYPTEFLNKQTPSGLPLSDMKLKVGCPVILLRNMDKRQDLCNGTKMIIKRISRRVLEAEICQGKYMGKTVFIPRIKLIPSEANCPFQFRRLQFPIHVAFAMSINKSQGQTLQNVGVFLPRPAFTHGQLYVAMSRVSDPLNLKFLIYDEDDQSKVTRKTKNVVFRSALLNT